MIRLIASDIDGTLLQNGETEISQRFFEQAGHLIDRGIAVCAASGRQYKSLRRLFQQEAERMYFLCENGAVVYGPGQRLISRTIIPRDIALRLCHEILDIPDCEVLMSGTNISYLCPKQQDFADLIQFYVGNNVSILPNPEAMPEEFVKISAYYRAGAELVEPLLKPNWEAHFQVAIAGPPWLDFTVADKGTGIRALCADLGIPAEEAMAFGDNYNDIAMLDAVGSPYIMNSAAQPLRERYANHCSRVEDVLEGL